MRCLSIANALLADDGERRRLADLTRTGEYLWLMI